VAAVHPGGEEGDGTLRIQSGLAVLLDGESEGTQAQEGGALRPRGRLLEELVGEEGELPFGGHAGILLAQRAGGGVPGIGVQRQPLGGARLVEYRERRLRHVDLAAHLAVDRLAQPFGDRADRAHVCRHVLPGGPVAARRRADEAPALVAQADREAIDLELGDERWLPSAEALGGGGGEGEHLFGRERVGEAEHRPVVPDLAQAAGSPATRPDALRRRVAAAQLRVGRLELLELAAQGVVGRVGDLRRIVDVVGRIGRVDLRHEFGVAPPSRRAHPITSRLARLAASVFTPLPAKATVTSSSWRVSREVTTIPSPKCAWRTRSPSA